MRMALVAIVALAVLVRLVVLVADPNPSDNAGLALNHGEMARNIVDKGRWFTANLEAFELVGAEQERRGELVDPADVNFAPADAKPRYQPVVLQPVGAGAVLAGLWFLSGDEDYVYLQLLQIALDALMVLLVFWIAMRLYRRPLSALLAAGMYAVFVPIVILTKIPHLDIWGVYFTISIVALAVRAWQSERALPWLLAAGALTGLGLYFRPGVLLVPLALAAAALPWIGWRRALPAALVPLVAAAALAVPWTIRNYDEFDRFIPTRIGIGQNLWEGLGEVQNDFGAVLDDQATARQVAKEDPSLEYGTPEYDDHLRDKAEDAIRDHPGHFAKVVARRAFVTTVGLHNLSLPVGLLEPLLFVLAVGIAAATWRRYPRQHTFLAAVPLATALPYLVLHVEPRYMLPASFVYLIWLALGVDLAIERRRAASTARRTASAA
jgi:4-amino-4-deoxy-L-arabinose transferase-like glycosyltransferase